MLVLIPLKVRSISTGKLYPAYCDRLLQCLNPFESQVYFHRGPGKALCGAALQRHFREPPAVWGESCVRYSVYFSIPLI